MEIDMDKAKRECDEAKLLQGELAAHLHKQDNRVVELMALAFVMADFMKRYGVPYNDKRFWSDFYVAVSLDFIIPDDKDSPFPQGPASGETIQ